MKNKYAILSGVTAFCLLIVLSFSSPAQTFHKHSLLLSISEGSTNSNFTTTNIAASDDTHHQHIKGCRDPLMVEYGLSKHWGIGLTMGTDIFNVNPATFYNYSLPGNTVKSTTSDFTVDADYHLIVTKRTDISAFAGFGGFSVKMSGSNGDYSYNYLANGNIIRMGTRARYYFFKRVGVFGMLSAYSGYASPKGIKKNTMGSNYATGVSGSALEFGLCVRLF